jgi:hypothetical protein
VVLFHAQLAVDIQRTFERVVLTEALGSPSHTAVDVSTD